ncbi:MAG: hypothetical protein WC486_03450 [Candidatus Omnitrophota bacterium]
MKIAILLILILFWITGAPVIAQNTSLKTSWETGKISTSEILEEEDISADLTYNKYRFSLEQELSPEFTLGFDNTYYRKDYEGQSALSNHSNQAQISLNYLPENNNALTPSKLSFKYLNKGKYYEHSEADRYIQNKAELGAAFKKDDDWRLNLKTGFNDYSYNSSSGKNETQLYFNTDVTKKLLDERLTLSTLSRVKHIERRARNERNQYIWGQEASYKLNLPYFKEVSASIQKGQMQTQDEDERDDERDFKYTTWQVKSRHPLLKELETTLKYQMTKREYNGANYSWKRTLFENMVQYKLIDKKSTDLSANLKVYHKKIDFLVSRNSNYDKNSAALELKLNQKGDYKLSGGFGWNQKDYSFSPLRNRDAYTWKASLEKTISELTFYLDYKHELKDYEYASDRTYDVVKCAVEYRF